MAGSEWGGAYTFSVGNPLFKKAANVPLQAGECGSTVPAFTVEWREDRKKKTGDAEVCCSVWPGRSCVWVDAHRRQNKREGGQKRKEGTTTTTTTTANSSKSLQVADRTVTARLSIHKPLVSPEPCPTPPCLWRHTRRWMSPLFELW